MTHILLYWNHICVLHRQEKAFLQELAGRLQWWSAAHRRPHSIWN